MQEHSVLVFAPRDLRWKSVRSTLNILPSVRVVADTDEPDKSLELAFAYEPDVLLAAEEIEGASTLESLSRICGRCPHIRVVMIADHLEPWQTFANTQLGITSFLLWRDLSPGRLSDVLGVVVYSPGFSISSTRVRNSLLRAIQERLAPSADGPSLTDRERTVLRCLMEGMTREQIALAEGMSEQTVKRAIASIGRKLDAPTQFILGAKAARYGLLDQGSVPRDPDGSL